MWRILCNGDVDSFVDVLNGYNPSCSRYVTNSWNGGRVVVDERLFSINLELIVVANGLENSSWQYNRKMKIPIFEIQLFYRPSNPLPISRKFAYYIYSIR